MVIPVFSSPSICTRKKKLWRSHKIRFTLFSKNDKNMRKCIMTWPMEQKTRE
ncbi:unnamed protein product [Brassica rapa subsp. narinosa]